MVIQREFPLNFSWERDIFQDWKIGFMGGQGQIGALEVGGF